ncbi:FAD-dependent monooxygenase [Flocculibacter collagenilyticus]|uniref:FAD-dependent monooxygenase n=1 Tax=Flocculibacter collagenilyticus TaxID=2744479 RepID=UPI0018F387AA|nr:FAD-dependent monooxygenase [Flocculibacter collagenilyticus]
MISTDVIIVGGGCVGLTLAAALGEKQINCVVIDAQPLPNDLPKLPDTRVSAISAASEAIFKRLGVWPLIESQRLQPYQGMSVCEQDSFGAIEFSAQSIHQPRLGHIIENNVIRRALLTRLASLNSVTVMFEQQCNSINVGEREAMVALQNGSPIIGKLIVAADGANSFVRKQFDFPLTFWDYDHTAIVATVATELPHQSIARQIFLPTGPLAFLPLNDAEYEAQPEAQSESHSAPHLCSIVWSTSHEHAQALTAMEEREFNKALTAAFNNQLGLCNVISARTAIPLRMRYSQDWIKPRVALMGDAAHTIHPLAGLGMNLGLMDAAALAQTIISQLAASKDIGDVSALRSYERWRKAEAQTVIAAMEGLKRLFTGTNPLLKFVRSVGLSATDKLTPVKHQIIQNAMGLKGDLPDLAKPLTRLSHDNQDVH